MPITDLPTPPSRQDPTNFANRADEFLGALPAFATQANALEAEYEAAATAAAEAVLTSKLNSTNPSYTGTLTGGTGVVNIGSGQLYKDSAGNFGLGVTPSAASLPSFESTYGIFVGRAEANITANAWHQGGWKYVGTGGASQYQAQAGAHRWFTAPSGTAGNPISFTQAMTLDASGNLNINTPGAAGNRLYVVQSGADNIAARFQNSSNNFASNNIYSVLDGAGNATTAANHFVAFASGADVLAIRGNGNIVNTNNSYGAISDLKLKENIVDVTPKLAKLLQVRIVNYTLKSDPTKAKLIGVIAQELEQISPGLIEETRDYEEVKKTREVEAPAVEAVLDAEGNEVTPAVPATTRTEEYTERVPLGTVTKSVKYSVFVPMLIKGMQEQQAQIETLQSQVDTQNTAMQLLVGRLEALEAK